MRILYCGTCHFACFLTVVLHDGFLWHRIYADKAQPFPPCPYPSPVPHVPRPTCFHPPTLSLPSMHPALALGTLTPARL